MDYIYTVKLTNFRDADVHFVLEPWGEQYIMSPKASFVIVASAPLQGELEIEVDEKRIVVYGWSGSVVQLFQDGNNVGGSTQPVPPLPRM